MGFFVLLSVLAQPELDVDAPTWAPILFAAGAFVVVVLVLILVKQKLRQFQMRNDDPDDPEIRDDDDH